MKWKKGCGVSMICTFFLMFTVFQKEKPTQNYGKIQYGKTEHEYSKKYLKTT